MSAGNDRVVAETTKKSYREILREEVRNGWSELNRPGAGLFLSGVSAGLDVGFSLLLMAVLLSLGGSQLPPLPRRALLAAMYAVGYIFVNLGRSELFTEHTTLMMYPVFGRNVSLVALLRVWCLVYVGNLLGATLFAALAAGFAPRLGIVDPLAFRQIAEELVRHPGWVALVSGVIAGWLMGLLSWLVAATQDTVSQIICVGMITWAIGFMSLHHCIAGSVEVLSSVFSGYTTPAAFAHFLGWSTLGNVGGGIVFATIKYNHAIRVHPGRERKGGIRH